MDFKKYLRFLPLILIINFFLIFYLIVKINEKTLMWFYPLVLIINLILIISFLCFGFKNIISSFKKINWKIWLVLILIIFLAFYFRMFITPHAHRVFYDEDIYLNMAQNIVIDGKSCLCDYGDLKDCFRCISNKQPYGFPAFYAIFFFFFGVSESVAINVSVIIATLSVFLVFFVSYKLFKKEKIALYSALIFALIPIHIKWSGTQALGLLLVFFSLLTILLFLIYFDNRKASILFASFFALAYTSQIRPESILMIFVVASLFIFMDKRIFKTIIDKKFLIAIALFLILILPTIEHTDNVKHLDWGAPKEKISIKFLENNLRDNITFFIENTRFPLIFTILSFIGIVFGLYKYQKKIIPFIIWFLLFFSIFIIFYAGSFNSGTDVRFSLNLYPSIAIFSGLGSYFLKLVLGNSLKKFKIKKEGKIDFIATTLVFILIIVAFIPFIKFVSSYGEEAWDARAVHDFAINESKNIKNCMVFSHVSSMFLVNGVPSIQPHMANKQLINKLHGEYDCLLFYEGYWCVNVPVYREGICKNMKTNYNLTLYKQFQIRNKNFTFYKIEK